MATESMARVDGEHGEQVVLDGRRAVCGRRGETLYSSGPPGVNMIWSHAFESCVHHTPQCHSLLQCVCHTTPCMLHGVHHTFLPSVAVVFIIPCGRQFQWCTSLHRMLHCVRHTTPCMLHCVRRVHYAWARLVLSTVSARNRDMVQRCSCYPQCLRATETWCSVA